VERRLSQDSHVRNRSCRGGDPGRVNEREHQHLGEDCRIIGMPDVVKKARRSRRRGASNPSIDVPVFPERRITHQRTAFAARNTANIAAASSE